MSKTTKIIAALGVVAGLGVAALPAFTYAQENVTGNADVYVEVLPSIAMTIVGNNDDTDGSGSASTQQYTTDPVTAGVGVHAPSGATVIDTYDAATMDIANGVSSSYASLLPNSSFHGGDSDAAGGFKSTITVYTNSTTGYNLGISGTGTSNALGALTQQGVASGAETIPATGVVKAGTAGWGYAVNTAVTSSSESTADTEHPNYQVAANSAIDTLGTKTTNGNVTKVYYGVSTDADQATGIYKATVTYTATTK